MTEEQQDVNDTMMNQDAPAEGAAAPAAAAADAPTDGAAEAPVKDDPAVAKRKAIQAIMRDGSLGAEEKRMKIQNLMSGGRKVAPPPVISDENLKCIHYERNCSIVAPCCNQVFGCRVCHDEASPPGHPPMNRFLVREVVCKKCNTRQATSNSCTKCGTAFGEYHCDTCNLWMDKSKKPFHCEDCGFCRLGGREAFRHCAECCMCISVHAFETHNCFKDKYKNECPVCFEYMFTSRKPPQDLPCGHAIHVHCFRKFAGFDHRCPICKKTVVSQQSMTAAWESRARDIAAQPMPEDQKKIADILCNDCSTRSSGLDWHFLGVQCPSCTSFNTVVEHMVRVEGGQQGAEGEAAPDGEGQQGATGEAAPDGGGQQGAEDAVPDGEATA